MVTTRKANPRAEIDSWPRLAAAAADARDDLRKLVTRLDPGITTWGGSPELMREMRDLAIKHAEALKSALKAPVARRRKPVQKTVKNLWDVAGK